MTIRLALPLALLLATANTASAQQENRVQFERGSTGAEIQGSVTGNDYVDYILGAGQGQLMTVLLSSGSASANFNILPPGSDNVAIFIGSNEGTYAAEVLPEGGDYRVRVYLMGNAADTGQTVPFDLTVSITAADGASGTITGVPNEAEQACLQAVTAETNNPEVVLLDSEFSEAGTRVIVGVGPDQAPWECIAYRDGSTAGVMSLTDEGSL